MTFALRRFYQGWLIAAAGLLLVASVGCEKPPFDVAPVHGKVTVDGKPLAQGRLMFTPVSKQGELEAGKPAYGRIQPDGSYVLYTYGDDDGAVVGEHGVTVINTDDTSKDANAPRFTRVSLPRRYQVVAGQDNEIDIEISKLEVAQYGR
jgi:hypothetical protein